jgi:class 3 adenylate cyclase
VTRSTKQHPATINTGIQANTVTGEVMAVGQGARATKIAGSRAVGQELPVSVAEPRLGPDFKIWAGASRTTLAIVFTDIVGSTALSSEVGNERMFQIREAHYRQARQLIQKSGGYEIQTVGDAFVVGFHTAVEALHFALARALRLHRTRAH